MSGGNTGWHPATDNLTGSDVYGDPNTQLPETVAAVNYGGDGCTDANPCGVGGADCDGDSNCLPGLLCMQRGV